VTAPLLLILTLSADGPPTLRDRLGKLPVPPTSPVVQGVLLGHAPAPGGWPRVKPVVTNPDVHFAVRLSGLRMLPALRTAAPDVLTDAEKVAVLTALLDQPDLSDLVADHLRRQKDWALTPAVLAAFGKPAAAPAVKRAVTVYALLCPEPAAKAFVADRRKADPDLVAKAEAAIKDHKLDE
jgi:hypothetical protein